MRTLYLKIFVIAGLVLVMANSCNEDNLALKPQGPTEQDYFKEEIEFERAVWGIYAKMNAHYAWNGGDTGNGGNNLNTPMWQLPGDDMTTTGTGDAAAFENFAALQASNGMLNRYFRDTYQLINRANIFLDKNAAVQPGIYVTANLQQYHRGEALFLRGLMFFELWNYFGIAPVVTKRIASTSESFAKASTGTELLDQAIADFTEAASLLPVAWSEINRGRASANAANGMLGKSLVFRGTVTDSNQDYLDAITAFNKISGASLVSFGDNFAADKENNAESLFEYQASQAASFEVFWLPNEFDNSVGSLSTGSWTPFEGINSWGYGGSPFIATSKLKNAFEPGDPRLPLTLDPATLAIKKYVLRDQKVPAFGSSVNNPRILRFADVLLLKAEAILKSGGSKAEAIGLINQIRTRARNSAATPSAVPADLSTAEANAQTIFQWIMDERFRELAFEEYHRWFDLRRWHLGGDISLTSDFFSSANTGFGINVPKHLYFPIPLNETDRNPNMSQNPGY